MNLKVNCKIPTTVKSWKGQFNLQSNLVNLVEIEIPYKGCSLFESNRPWCKTCNLTINTRSTQPRLDLLQKKVKFYFERHDDSNLIIKLKSFCDVLDVLNASDEIRNYVLSDAINKNNIDLILLELPVEKLMQRLDSKDPILDTLKDNKKIGFIVRVGTFEESRKLFYWRNGYTTREILDKIKKLSKDFSIAIQIYYKPFNVSELDALNTLKKDLKTISRTLSPLFVEIVAPPTHPFGIHLKSSASKIRVGWYWSIIEALYFAGKKLSMKNIRVNTSPPCYSDVAWTNCPSCDAMVESAINEYNLSGSLEAFADITCSCKYDWKTQLYMEPILLSDFNESLFHLK